MLIVEFEKEFEIKFTDDELISLIDYNSICEIISKKQKNEKPYSIGKQIYLRAPERDDLDGNWYEWLVTLK